MRGKLLKIYIIVLAVALLSSCSEDEKDENVVNPPATSSFEGTWKSEEVQLLQAPTANPGIWKPALVMWGSVSASTVGNLDITFRSDSTWIASGYLTNTAIKAMVKDHQPGTNYSANGKYVKLSNTFNVVMNNYTGRGPTTGTTYCDYTISGDKMTVTVNLPNDEKWKVIFKKQ